MKKERILWMDILNICACIGVLILHTNSVIVHQFSGEVNTSFIWGVLTHSLFYWPVPIFLMLSGCNLIGYNGGGKKYIKRRINKAVIPFCLWSFIYAVAFNIHNIENIFSLSTIHAAMNGLLGSGYMWFFIPLFAFYLSAPFITAMVKSTSVMEKRAFLLLSVIFCSIIPFIDNLIHTQVFRYNLFPMATSFLMYPIIGWIVNNDSWFAKHRHVIYLCGATACCSHFVALFYTISQMGLSSKVIQNTQFPLVVIMSVSVLLLFKHIKWNGIIKQDKWADVIKRLSSCSLGVYLIQNLLFVVSSKGFNLLNNQYYGFILTYIVGLIIVLVIKRIPYLNKLVP